jgi:hypothetical protein
MKLWERNRDRPLAQILKESAGLDDARQHALAVLSAAHLTSHHDDLRLSLRALNAEDLIPDAMTEIAESDPMTLPYTSPGCEATLSGVGCGLRGGSGPYVLGPSFAGVERAAI